MRNLTLILFAIFNAFVYTLRGQESSFKELDKLIHLKSKDTLWLDIRKGGCFNETWNKIMFTKKNDDYELVKINDITNILLKHNKTQFLNDNQDIWIKKNINQTKTSSTLKTLSIEEYQTIINYLIRSLKANKNCTTEVTGVYHTISLKTKKLKLKYHYNCTLQLPF
ncbi:conserved protein of unknown function [Tenacibaculum sp. 190130A14a]|uniref:Uncharacterized protein n=1 Tax=Tenacibaculum polynesiense TaxID=3137857 RepID=A0ABP1EVV8_9FLAO